ncbi:MAG: NADH-quinone oxidoreductase subunit M [Actinobacteria bacterium]|nr:NADH-quinone oxidoreductase subunit M [Actinomycetota bacterium]
MLAALILANLVIGAGLFLLPRRYSAWARWIALLPATASLAISIAVFAGYDQVAGGYQFEERLAWLPSIGIGWHTGIDGIAAPMVLLTGIVIFTGVLISWNVTERAREFFALLLMLVSGVFGVFSSLDLFFLFFFYEVAVLPMYLLIAVWGSTRREYAGMKLVMYLLAGSILIWVGLVAIYVAAGARSFDLLDLQAHGYDATLARVVFPLVYVGFGVLAGMWPFHTWSPDGHVAAPTAVSMLHAGVLMKLGAFGIIRVALTLLPAGARDWLWLFIILGAVNVVYGAFSALAQRDLKFVIGYSSVSHMGYVLMGLGTLTSAGLNGAVFQMFSHGIMTALFFAMVGVVYDRAHTREIAAFSGLAQRMPRWAALFLIAGLASLGLPGLSGFAAEFMVFLGTFQSYPVLGVLAVLGVAITAVYILRLAATVFFGPLPERWAGLSDASRLDVAAGAVLSLTLLVFGLFPPLLYDQIDTAVAPLLTRVLAAA